LEKSPWEATSSSASQEIPCILCKPETHSKRPLVPILGETNPAHAYPPYFLKIHFNIIAPSTIMSCKWSLHQNPVCTFPLLHTRHIPPSISFYTSFQRTCPGLRLSVPLRKTSFYGEEVSDPQQTLHDGWPNLFGCTRLLIQYIRSYPP
jgi:hypothetical protein